MVMSRQVSATAESPPVQQSWDKDAVRQWALEDFPEAFGAVCYSTHLEFVDADYEKMKASRFAMSAINPTKLLAIGLYDDDLSDTKDIVYAFLQGNRHNQVGYVVERSNPGYYDSVQMRCIDVAEPFCNITDGSERFTATWSRLRSIICYFFLASGYIDSFGSYKAWAPQFRKACLWIANGGFKPIGLYPKSRQRCSSLRTSVHTTDTAGELSTGETAVVNIERPVDIQSEDDHIESSQDLSRPSPLADTANDLVQSEQESSRDKTNFDVMLRHVGLAYDRLDKGNKRLKLDMDEARAQEAELKNSIGDLFAEKVNLQTELREEKSRSDKLCKDNLGLKRGLAAADKRADEAEATAMKRYTKDREQLIAQVQKEKARADAAEEKLAGIRAYFGNPA